jgi:hypothetical protein
MKPWRKCPPYMPHCRVFVPPFHCEAFPYRGLPCLRFPRTAGSHSGNALWGIFVMRTTNLEGAGLSRDWKEAAAGRQRTRTSTFSFFQLDSPRSRGLSEHGVFFCEKCCIPAHMPWWGCSGKDDFGNQGQRWWFTRDSAERVSMMTATWLSCKGHCCLSCTLNRDKSTSANAKIAWFNQTP